MTVGPTSLNGKTGEFIRYLLALVLAGTVAYFTAQNQIEHRLTSTDGDVAVIKTLEQSHFEEVQRSLTRIERAIERIEETGADAKTGEPYHVQRQFEK